MQFHCVQTSVWLNTNVKYLQCNYNSISTVSKLHVVFKTMMHSTAYYSILAACQSMYVLIRLTTHHLLQ